MKISPPIVQHDDFPMIFFSRFSKLLRLKKSRQYHDQKYFQNLRWHRCNHLWLWGLSVACVYANNYKSYHPWAWRPTGSGRALPRVGQGSTPLQVGTKIYLASWGDSLFWITRRFLSYGGSLLQGGSFIKKKFNYNSCMHIVLIVLHNMRCTVYIADGVKRLNIKGVQLAVSSESYLLMHAFKSSMKGD